MFQGVRFHKVAISWIFSKNQKLGKYKTKVRTIIKIQPTKCVVLGQWKLECLIIGNIEDLHYQRIFHIQKFSQERLAFFIIFFLAIPHSMYQQRGYLLIFSTKRSRRLLLFLFFTFLLWFGFHWVREWI